MPYAVLLFKHGVPLRSPFPFCIKLFFGPFPHLLHTDFLFLALPISQIETNFTERLVAPSPAASRLPLFLFSSLRRVYLPYESPQLVLPCHLMSGPFVFQPPFHNRFDQTCSETKTLQILLKSFCFDSLAHVFSYFSYGGSLCSPSLFSLESAFLHC